MIGLLPATLRGVRFIQRRPFEDFRGLNGDIYDVKNFLEAGFNPNFISFNFSYSRKNVLRGLHGDDKTWKLISCLYGKIYLVVLNYDDRSEEYGKWQSFILTPQNGTQIIVPPKFANGHLVLSDKAVFHYAQTRSYAGAENQFSIRWNDPRFGISWPITNPILSQRDGGEHD